MGRLINGINGPFVGKVGTAVGVNRKGKCYIRSLPIYNHNRKIEGGEKTNRSKFAMSQAWLQPIIDFVRVGFKGYSPTVEGFLAAKSYLSKHAFEVTDADVRINPALVKISMGELPLPENISVTQTVDHTLQITWDASNRKGFGLDDQVMILAYDIDNKRGYGKIYGQGRSTGADIITLSEKNDRTYHIYVAFVAADRSMQSDSVYLGEIRISS
jgi:hypothetical protein